MVVFIDMQCRCPVVDRLPVTHENVSVQELMF